MSGPARQYALLPLDYAIREAIDFLRHHEPPEGYFVGFSGGKDSIVTIELCRMAGVKYEAYYSCTTIDPPEVVKFIRQNYPAVKWLRPAMSFYSAIKKKSPPLRMKRWCCDILKKDPSKAIPLKVRVTGIRAEESIRRASRPRIDLHKKYGFLMVKPIFSWAEWMVWDFIDQMGLPYPSLYDEGWGRIGCVVCPFIFHKNQSKVNAHKKRWPGIYRAFESACHAWFEDKRTTEEWRGKHDNFEDYMAAYYRGFEE